MTPAVILAAATAVPLARRFFGGAGRAEAAAGEPPAGPLPRALVLLALAVNLGLFLVPVRAGPLTLPDPYPSGTRLLARNEELARRDEAIRSVCDPDSTLILAYDRAFHAAYFLPEYRVVGLFPVFKQAADNWVPSARYHLFSFEPGSKAIPDTEPLFLPDEIRRIIVYDEDYLPFWPSADLPLRPLPYDVGGRLMTAALPGPGCLDYGFRRLEYLPEGRGPCSTVGVARVELGGSCDRFSDPMQPTAAARPRLIRGSITRLGRSRPKRWFGW